MRENADSKDKLFSSLSKLENTSAYVEVNDASVLDAKNENKMFILFCVSSLAVGLACTLYMLMANVQVESFLFDVLLSLILLSIPSIVMCGALKAMINNESVEKHIVTMIIVTALFFTGCAIHQFFQSASITVIAIFVATVVMLVIRYRSKWLLALFAFFLFCIIMLFAVNFIRYVYWWG